MKNILKIIVLMSLFLASGAEVDNTQKVYAQESCEVIGVKFSQINGAGNLQTGANAKTTLKIESSNCEENGLNVQIISLNESLIQTEVRIDNAPGQNNYKPEAGTGSLWIEFNADEAEPYACSDNDNQNNDDNSDIWGYECVLFVKIFDASNGTELHIPEPSDLVPNYISSASVTDLLNKGILVANCQSLDCDDGDQDNNDSDNWKVVNIEKGSGLLSGNCFFSNDSPNPDVYFTGVTGESFTDQLVRLNIKTNGKCDGLPLTIILEDYAAGTALDFDIEISDLPNDTLNVNAPIGEDLYVDFRVNEDGCDSASVGWNCTVYADIEVNNGDYVFETEEYFSQYSVQEQQSDDFKNNVNLKKGILAYECKELDNCRNDSSATLGFGSGNAWKFVGTNGVDPDSNEPQILETVEPDFDENSPCYVEKSTTPASDDGLERGEEGIDRDCYEFLAPIPGFGDAQIINGQETGRVSIKLSTLELGDYINTMFQIALGILMVLSVVMIVVGGVQYMTSEAIFQKQVAKESITKAVVGLILGLGIFIILNTINPRLLEINFGSNIEEVSLTTKVYDESQLDYIESIDIAGISIPVDGSVYNDPAFLAYIYHQQGNGGASSILWHSSRNTNNLIRRYGVSPTTLQRQLVANRVNTPNQWVDYFYRKIKASEQKINIIPEAHIEAIDLAASELNVDAEIFKAICLIETSGCAGATTVNSLGYTGLFQFNPTIFNSVKKSANSDIFDPYENAYAAMKLYQQNISFFNQRRNEILNQ